MKRAALAVLCLTGCSGRGLRMGDGEIIAVEGSAEIPLGALSAAEASARAQNAAERSALSETLSVYLSSAARERYGDILDKSIYSRSADFIRRTKVLREGRRTGASDGAYGMRVKSDIRLARLTAELDRLSLVEELESGKTRVVLSLLEPDGRRGEAGRASQALRRSLIRRGFSVFDLSDGMISDFKDLGEPEETRAAALKLNAGMTITGKAQAGPAPDPRLAGYHRFSGSLRVALSTAPAANSQAKEFSAAATAVDLDEEGARNRALEAVGELLGEKISGQLIFTHSTRHEITLALSGLSGFARVSGFIARLRGLPEIVSASLRTLSPAGVRLRLSALRSADEVAAALMRLKDYSIRTLSVEDDLIELEID